MLDTQELRTFAAVARHLSFARAANELGQSSSNVSKCIAQLERKLQTTLFTRSTRTVRLSDQGMQLLPSVLRALDSIEEASDFFQSPLNSALSGSIRLTAPQTLAQRLLSPLLAIFHRKYPELNIELVLSDRYLDLVEEGLDLALRVMSLHNSSLKALKIAKNPVALFASPQYLRQSPPLKKVEDLKHHEVFSISTHMDLQWKNHKKSLRQCIRKPWIKSTNGDLLVEQACLGTGVVVRSRWGAQRELDAGTLVEVKMNDQLLSDTAVYLVYPENRFVPKRVRAFIDFMRSTRV